MLPEENEVRRFKATVIRINIGLEIRVNQPVSLVMRVNQFVALPRELYRAKVSIMLLRTLIVKLFKLQKTWDANWNLRTVRTARTKCN